MELLAWDMLVGGQHHAIDLEVAAYLSWAQRTRWFCAFSAIGLKINFADGEVTGSRWET